LRQEFVYAVKQVLTRKKPLLRIVCGVCFFGDTLLDVLLSSSFIFSIHRGVQVANKPRLVAVRLSEVTDDFRKLLQAITEFPPEQDRRKINRVPRSLVVSVQPLDNNMQPTGACFKAVSRDISTNGMGFFQNEPFPTSFVRIGPNENSVSQSVARVCFNKAYHGEQVQYLVGVEFLSHS